MNITEGSLRRPVTVIICTLALMFFGLYVYTVMPRQKTPDIDFPMVTVVTTMDGANASVMDNDVADVLEDQINGISGVSSITSRSYPGRSVTVIEFEMERDISDAANDVRDKVALAAKNLPDEADAPVVSKVDLTSEAVIQLAITGEASKKEKTYFVDKILKARLQTVNNVGTIETPGLLDREIRIWVAPETLHSYGLIMDDLAQAVAQKHVELPAGSIFSGSYDIDLRVNAEYATVDELKSLPLTVKDGKVIRLGDIATVEDGFAEEGSAALLNDEPAIIMDVKKQSGANEVDLCQGILKMLDEVRPNIPPGIDVKVIYNQADFVDNSLNGAASDVCTAVLLCAVLMFIFLQTARATIVPVVAIPVCLLGSFLVMARVGITLNGISMLAISLSVGMVVDATTVVIENIDRHLHAGEDSFTAALEGTKEVSFAVLGGVLTTVAVFSPIAYMSGIVGKFFRAFGITVIMTILISYILAMTLSPFLCSRILKITALGKWGSFFDGKFRQLEAYYRQVLTKAVHNRARTLLIALLLFVVGIIIARNVGSSFVPTMDEGQFQITCELPTGTSLDETRRTLKEIGEIARENPYVAYTYTTIGTNHGREKNQGTVYVQLIDRSERPMFLEVQNQLRPFVRQYKDVRATFQTRGGKDVTMSLVGPSIEAMVPVAEEVMEDLRATGNFRDISTDVRLDKPEYDVIINRGLTDMLNVNVRSLSRELYAVFGGMKVGVFKESGYRYDIRLMAPRHLRRSLDSLDNVYTKTAAGDMIQANNLFDVKLIDSPRLIKRYNRQRSMMISANVTPEYSTGEGIEYLAKVVRDHVSPDSGINVLATGRNKRMREDFQRLFTAIVTAIILVYVVMAIQFESFLHPFVVMFSLPLLTPGSFGLLYLAGCKLDLMSYMGLILLVGIVVNNGIILVDFIKQEQERGVDVEQAAINAGPLRLRAILITALSTLVGAIPGALQLTEGSELRQSMNLCIVGGLLTSTLLTLIVIPVVYISLEKFIARTKARFGIGD